MSREAVQAENYAEQDLQQFVRDMEDAGLKCYHYRGRFYWEGPAVDVHNIQDVLSNTKIRCQWDSMGLDMVVYPRTNGKFHEEPQPIVIREEVDDGEDEDLDEDE